MAEYMDLLVVENPKMGCRLVAQAPWMSRIEIGYDVEFNYRNYDSHGTVVGKMDIRKGDTETLNFLRLLSGEDIDEEIPKVTRYYKEIEVEYDA